VRRIVTEWFRIPRVWPILAAALAAFDRPVTVWSGACGSGEEAWSAAILLDEHGIGGQVLATDLDPDLLAIAEAGHYSARDVRSNVAEGRLTRAQVSRHLRPADGGYTVAPHLRRRVTFRRLCLGEDAAPACDAALLRNVWRHLEHDTQARLMREVHARLPATGRLVLGGGDLLNVRLEAVEPPGLSRYFTRAGHDCVWRPRS